VRASFPLKHLLIAAVGAFLLTSCDARVANRGNLPDPDLLDDIEVGKVKRGEVAEILGSPSSIALFKGESWYYISETNETWAFFEPEVKKRKIIVIRFDEKGVVQEKKTFGLEKARELELVDRETKTAGQEFSLIRQLFSNVGRFEK